MSDSNKIGETVARSNFLGKKASNKLSYCFERNDGEGESILAQNRKPKAHPCQA